jgi:hypothetical protein
MKEKVLTTVLSALLIFAFSFSQAYSQTSEDAGVKQNLNIEKHSVPAAVFSSFLPVWSGSWNTEFTGWGLAFVIMKTGASAFLVYSIATYDSNKHSLGLNQTTEVNGETTSSSQVSDSAVMVALSSAVLVMNIIADCIYSGIKTKRYNYNQENKNAFSLGDDKLFLAIEPKIEYLNNNHAANTKNLGFDIGVISRF